MPEFEESEGFKLKSGNKSSFKDMGSSPADLNIGEIFKNVHGALTGTEGKEFKDTKFGQALTRGKKQIQANISDDVKGNLFENVGKSVFTPNAKADNATEDDVNENIIAPQTDEPSTGTYEVQKGDFIIPCPKTLLVNFG